MLFQLFTYLKFIFFILFVLMVNQFFGQVFIKKSDSLYLGLNEIHLTGIINDQKLHTVTSNIQLLSSKDIKENNGLNYNTIFNQVPGVFMQSGTLNTNRITIRGIGARSPFSTTSIRAYFGNIPLTDGNGISSIEDIELASVSNIEIHKGPSASSFGVGLGGVIILKPIKLFYSGLEFVTESIYGSFGLYKNIHKINYGRKNIAINYVYSNTQSEGYRENNEYNRESHTINTTLKVTNKDELLFLGNYNNLKAFIPSSVNLETFNSNPKSAAFFWGSAQGFEDFNSYLTGVSWQHKFPSDVYLNSSVFTTGKKNYEPRPFNILDENVKGYGVRSRLSKNTTKTKWGIGGELFYDTNTYRTFENLYEDFPLGTGSVLGVKLSDYKEYRNYFNVFGEFTYKFHNKWYFNTGFNINKTDYKIDDNFNLDDENQSGKYSFDVIFSPKVGLSYQLNNQIRIRAIVAHGFAPPTTEETLLPDGFINTDLQPEKGWNFELGTNFSFLKNRLYGDLSVYNLKVTDLLVDRRAENEALFAINAGKTNHLGIEGNLNYILLKSKNITVNGFTNGSIYNYRFENFVDDTEDFSGNKLTGVPDAVFNTGIRFNTSIGFYGNFNFQYVGNIPINDENIVFSDAYKLTNGKIGYQITLKEHFKIDASIGINNLFDEKYASQLQVNAGSFGGNAPRYYYAGNPINYYGGIKISYKLF